MITEPVPPPIRTFHPRRGRMGTTQTDALTRLWPRYGFTIDSAAAVGSGPEFDSGRGFDSGRLFGRRAPLVLEIGCGMGDATIAMAHADPERDYLAVDVHTPGLGSVIAAVESLGLTNVRVARGDALELVRDAIPSGSLDAIHVFFPDPWPKARHHKRRIIQPDTVALLRDRLIVGGTLHTATDWPDYATQMLDVLSADPGLRNTYEGYAPRPPHRPVTKYERRGVAAGRTIRDCVFKRDVRPRVPVCA